MKKLLFYLLLLACTGCMATSTNWVNLIIFENESISVRLEYQQEADFFQEDWLALSFQNKSADTLRMESFSYDIDGVKVDEEGEVVSTCHLGGGNKFRVFPVFESRPKPSAFQALIPPRDSVRGYRGISNRGAAFLGHSAGKDQDIKAQIRIKGRYTLGGVEQQFSSDEVDFQLLWKSVSQRPVELSHKLYHALESPNVPGHGAIIRSLINDTTISYRIPREDYVRLIVNNPERSPQLSILKNLLSQYGQVQELDDYYLHSIPTANWVILEEIGVYWSDSFFEPLVGFIEQNGSRHLQQCLKLLTDKYELWENDTALKTKLYTIIRDDCSQVVVRPDQLTSSNRHSWSSCMKRLKLTRAPQLESYLIPFLEDKTDLYPEDYDILKWHANPLVAKFYPASRVCDVAFEAIQYVRGNDLAELYKNQSVTLGLKVEQSEDIFASGPYAPLRKKEYIFLIRDQLIEKMINEQK